ncbi:ABC transporter permease/M1 family aminopeptidase [Pontibacter populi]|uniref:ABC transporter permease n=1 Tax=Pontibacter populi TaxID=890055 RepID=A0ABV1RYQ6_9BACT
MKLQKIISYEFAYQLRTVSAWLYFVILFVFASLMPRLGTPTDGVYANAPSGIVFVTILGCMLWLLMTASIAGYAAARDVQTRMYPLIYTLPISKASYLGGRFIAAFALNAFILLALPVGMLLSFSLPGINPELMGPFRPGAYLTAYAFIALPNAFIATAIQFSFAVSRRRAIASYIASVLLVVFAQIIGTSLAKLIGNWDLVKLLDPVGILGIISTELETWTPIEKNTRLILLEGMFLWNRVLWLGMAVGMLLFIYLRFRFAHPTESSWWSRLKKKPNANSESSARAFLVGANPVSVPQVQRMFGFLTHARQAFAIAWSSCGMIIKSRIGITLVAAMALISVIFGVEIMTHAGIPLLPTTQQIADYLTSPVDSIKTPWIIIPLLIIYFAGELVWRERESGLNEISNVAPVTEWVFFMGKYLGLGLAIIVWLLILMLGGILMKVVLDYQDFEIGLYLQTILGLQLIEYLLFALLVLVVHVVVNQKYMAHLVVLFTYVFIVFPSKFGVEHNLLVFGANPGWLYTDMRGFGPSLGPWLWFKGYWIAWTLLLAVVARLLWVRSREESIKSRLQLAQRRFTRSTALFTAVAVGLVFILGGFIFYNTNVLNDYSTASELKDTRADYEKRYGRYEHVPQPSITSTKLHVELYPKRQEAAIRGTYQLVNKSKAAINSIYLATVPGVESKAVTLDRKTTSILTDEEHGHRIYTLQNPLQPGDSLKLSFEVYVKQNGFSNNGAKSLVLANGTYFLNHDLLPAIGYQWYRGLRDAASRKKYGMPPRPMIPSLYDAEARQRSHRGNFMAFEATVGTAEDQIAVAPGKLHKTWQKGNRRYFHYATDYPIQNQYAFFSANYAMQEAQWKNVAIKLYYHPKHAANVSRMLKSIKASLVYYTDQFGPYPYGHITIVERADAGGELNAEASMVDYGEQFALLNPNDGPQGFNLPFYVIAHEVAHQWWGGAGLVPASVEGGGLLVEGLAVYSGMQVLEENYGEGHLRQYLKFLRESYEVPRSRATASLLRADDAFLYYRKGGLAMYALSQYIGKDQVNQALRHLLEKHRSHEPPLPTTLDLYRELKVVTPDSLHYMLHDLFEKNTYWELETEQFATEQTKAGAWQVTLEVKARKVVIDKAGVETEVPMNDWIEIGVFAPSGVTDKPLYLQKHRIRSGKQTIKVTVPIKPNRAGIDPNHLLIDLDLDDNVEQLGGEEGII